MNEVTKREKEKIHFIIRPRPERPEELSELSKVQKKAISEGVGIASRVFFRGLRVRWMSKQSVILPLIGVSKQKLLFSSMIFYLRSAECLFHSLHDSLCNTIVVGSCINFRLSICCFVTQYIVVSTLCDVVMFK